jgi:hypothetical protein
MKKIARLGDIRDQRSGIRKRSIEVASVRSGWHKSQRYIEDEKRIR